MNYGRLDYSMTTSVRGWILVRLLKSSVYILMLSIIKFHINPISVVSNSTSQHMNKLKFYIALVITLLLLTNVCRHKTFTVSDR